MGIAGQQGHRMIEVSLPSGTRDTAAPTALQGPDSDAPALFGQVGVFVQQNHIVNTNENRKQGEPSLHSAHTAIQTGYITLGVRHQWNTSHARPQHQLLSIALACMAAVALQRAGRIVLNNTV